MAEAGRSWYTELDFDSYVLDLLLLSWCAICFVIILSVNAIVSAFGPLQKQPQERSRGDTEGVSLTGAVLPVETAKWFNDAISWFYLHYYFTPDFTIEWLKSLNEQLVKLGGPVQAKFERIQAGSLPPKIISVSSEASPQDRFIIHAKLETRDLSFVVFASQQTHEGVKLTNLNANVLRLKGTLRVQSYREGGDVKVSFNFEGKPEIKVQIKPLNLYQDPNELVDLGVVESNVRHCLILTKTTFTVTHLLMPGNLNTINQDFGDKGGGQDRGRADRNIPGTTYPSKDTQSSQRPTPGAPNTTSQPSQQKPQDAQEPQKSELGALSVTSPLKADKTLPLQSISVQNEPWQTISVPSVSNQLQLQQQQKELREQIQQVPRREQNRSQLQPRPEGVFEPVEAQQLQNFLNSAPPKPPRMVGDKRLLVKVIKANGLPVREIGAANTVCMLSTDAPIQGFSTTAVKNTQNPFWDEHFLFDVTHDTQEVRVEIYDKGRLEEEFIGEAIVYVEDLRKTPSSRQILRLHPEAGNFDYNTGTITAEFLFMDPSEADLLLDSMTTTANNQLSPRRRNEIARSGGSVMNQSFHDGYNNFGLDGSPGYINKNYTDESPGFSYPDNSYLSGIRQQQNSSLERSPTDDLREPYALNRSYDQAQPITLKA